MSRFFTRVGDLVKDRCPSTMFHNHMTLSRRLVYAQSIEESKLSMISRNLKRGRVNDKNKPRFKKRVHNQNEPSAPKVKVEGGSGSQGVKPTCGHCGKNHFRKYQACI